MMRFSLLAFANGQDRLLGLAQDRHHYDLPLGQDAGGRFLTLLIALMTFLAALALAGMFTLQGIGARWSEGLDNKATIEIPAQTEKGALRSPEDIAALQKKAAQKLKGRPYVQSVDILDSKDIESLVSPWLGEGPALDDLPLPGLIAVDLSGPDAAEKVEKTLKAIDPSLRLDTHKEWLRDLLRLAGGLRTAALAVALAVGGAAALSVAGGVRARMAIHREDIELLHLMGARDAYITKQFQRHAFITALKGGLAGLAVALIALWILGAFSPAGPGTLLPQAALGWAHAFRLACLPVTVGALAALAARFTVLRTLRAMP